MKPGLVAALPFVIVPALLISGRAGALAAGCAGLLATIGVLLVLGSADTETRALIGQESLAGLWLAMQAAAFIVGGLFFYRCVRASEPGLFAAPRPTGDVSMPATLDRRRLYAACFLLGPFAESATGFGVGMIIALPVILNARARGLTALAFSLFSQMLVAWGSLGVGTAIGAELAGVPFADLAERSAWLQAPVLFGHLAVFWLLLTGSGQRPTLAQAADDVVWTGVLAIGLIVATTYIAPELGGLLATGALLVVRALRDEPGMLGRAGQVLRSAWPYVALTAILVATRVVPPVREVLQDLWSIRPLPQEVAFAPLYHPATSLVVIGMAALLASGRSGAFRPVAGEVWRLGWKPVLVTIVYVVLARLIAGGGLADALAGEATRLVGAGVVYLAPLFGGLSGFLTGSNTASNGLMMPVQVALARAAGVDVTWAAALQNVAGSTFTLLSPTRIATGCALLGLAGQDRTAYGRTWVFGATALAILMIVWAVLA